MPPRKATWDVKINGVGYQLANAGPVTPDGGIRPSYGEQSIEYPAARQASGTQSYGNWPAQVEAVWLVTDASEGFGQKVFDSANGRYYYGFADTRIPGQVTLPPQVNSTAVTAEVRIFDHFERTISGTDTLFLCAGRYVKYLTDPTSPDATSKDLGTGVNATSAATFQGGHHTPLTFVAQQMATGVPQPYYTYDGSSNTGTWALDSRDSTVAPRDCVFSDNGSFTVDNAAPMTLTLSSLNASQDKVYVTGTQPFEGIKVDMNAANADTTTLTVKYYNGSAYTAVSSLSDGTSASSTSFNQDGSITWTLPTDWVPDTITDSSDSTVSSNGYHVELTWNNNFDSDVTTTDIDLIQRDTALFFEVHNEKLFRISKESDGFKLSTSVDGALTATWQAVATVTDLSNPVTNMKSAGNRLYITSEKGLHVLAGNGASISNEVWPHPRDFRDASNGIGGSAWRGQFWSPSRFGLYAFSDTNGYIVINTKVNPAALLENDSPIAGKVTCFAGDDFFGYAIVRNEEDSKSYLLSYNFDNESWHTLVDLGDITSRQMWVSDVGHASNPLLYFAAGDDIRYVVLPRHSPNPLQDSNCRFDTSSTNVGQIYLGRFNAAFEYEIKAFLTGKVMADNMSSTETLTYEYRVVDGGSWNSLSSFQVSPVGTANFGTTVVARWIEVRATLASGSTSTTPVLRSVYTSFNIRFPFKRTFNVAVQLRELGSENQGRINQVGKIATFKDTLKTAMSSSSPIEFIPLDKTESLEVIAVDYRVFSINNTASKSPEYIGYCEFIEHQATVRGTHARLSAYTHAALAAYTHEELQTL